MSMYQSGVISTYTNWNVTFGSFIWSETKCRRQKIQNVKVNGAR